MQQELASVVEKTLLLDRHAQFRGTVKVWFDSLEFGSLCPRKLDTKAVTYLTDKFKTQGVLRMDPKNRIPGLIDAKTLQEAIEASSGTTLETLLDNPGGEPPLLRLPPNTRIECLQGLHRIEAGRKILSRKDWWWTIDLYLNDANRNLQTVLSQEYSDSVNFSDGEIFQAIRGYHYNSDKQLGSLFAEKCMWARLSMSKRKDLKQILKHEEFTKALDALLVLPGVWIGFRIEHKFMSLKCDEEILHYLYHILTSWMTILAGRKELTQYVDRMTVENLQLRAPGTSDRDLSAVEKVFKAKALFPGIEDERNRLVIWEKLKTFTYLIPSMYTLFEDIKYLKAPANALKRLFSKTPDTVYQHMTQCLFLGRNQSDHTYLIQTSEQSFREEPGNSTDQIEFGYRQVWLYLWRHWTELVPECPRKDDSAPTPVPQKPNVSKWFELATLTAKLGFESDEINNLLSSDPDRKLAIEVLHKARDPEYFTYEESAFQASINQVVAIFNLAIPKSQDDVLMILDDACEEALERRCGRTFDKAYKHSRKHLFLDALHQYTGNRRNISCMFVRASVYFAFFGRHIEKVTATDEQGVLNTTIQLAEEATASTQQVEEAVSEPNTSTQQVEEANSELTTSTEQVEEANSELTTSTEQVEEANSERSPTLPSEPSLVSVAGSVESRQISTVTRAESSQQRRLPARIFVMLWAYNELKEQERPLPIDRDEVTRVMAKKERLGFRLFDTFGRALSSKNCFDAVVRNGTNTILLSRVADIDVNRQLLLAVANSLHEIQPQEGGPRKRRVL